MNIDLSNRLYKIGERVYFGTTELNVHNQRGRLFIKHKGKQININNIPILPKENDPVFDYIFGGGYVDYPCYAMQYWIERWRLKKRIYIIDFMAKVGLCCMKNGVNYPCGFYCGAFFIY